MFGISDKKPDFEWPATLADIEIFKGCVQVKIIEFNWKDFDKGSYKALTALQAKFSNKAMSPLFLAKEETSDNLQVSPVDQSAPICSIEGDFAGYVVKRAIFFDKNKKERCKIFAYNDNKG